MSDAAQTVGIEEIPPILNPDNRPETPTITVSVARILSYQEGVQTRAQRQADSINRLLLRIDQLEQRNKDDATEIARLTGLLVERETDLGNLQVQHDRAAEERNELAATVRSMHDLMDTREASHTIDGEPISHAGEVVWEHRLDAPPLLDEAVLALPEGNSTPIAMVALGEERPGHVL